MPLVQTRGAASAQGFGEFAQASVRNYIEEVFSTYLYTGNSSTQTITNGIDLSTKGGLVWVKWRSGLVGSGTHVLVDTIRGANNYISSNNTTGQSTQDTVSAFNTTGFNLTGDGGGKTNYSGDLYASWTFREQPKFFDVVTYTGTGSNTTIAHSLGSVPGSIIVKRTDTTAAWAVYHRSLANTEYLVLNTTAAAATGATWWNSTTPTSAVFSVGTDASVNASGGTYVAYLFAHDAGGFGLTGTDNVISCGSFTADNAGGGPYSGAATVNLGYEPQWVLIKEADSTLSEPAWMMLDTFRGYRAQETSGSDVGQQRLKANTSAAEGDAGGCSFPTATGFSALQMTGGATYIYIAIRRGPMKVPTLGTSVFDPDTLIPDPNLIGTKVTTPFVMDFLINTQRSHAGLASTFVADRLRGGSNVLFTNSTSAETALGSTYNYKLDYNDGFVDNVAYPNGTVTTPMIYWSFKRAPSFFDEVCYTGTGSNTTQTHNLGVVPELIIVKRRDTTGAWDSYCSALANTEYIVLNTTAAKATGATRWNSTTPTSSVFSVGTSTTTNASAGTYVAYLFATCAGVSKVGTYTGTGTTLQIDCGFTGGARFVLIKRTDSTGDWYVWDSARGIIAGNDPYLLLNSTAAEVTGTDYVDTYNAGFEISSTAPSAINASAGTFIFLAIA